MGKSGQRVQGTEDSDEGLICAYRLDGAGGGQPIGWDRLSEPPAPGGLLWIHLDYSAPRARAWLRKHAALGKLVAGALIAEDVRPRGVVMGEGLQINLRGVNLNPSSNPEDMISVRAWIEPQRIITTRRRRMLTTADLSAAIAAGQGPRNAGEFLTLLIELLSNRIGSVVEDVEEAVDDLQGRVLQARNPQLRNELSATRRQIIGLRRYLAPQREGVSRLYLEKLAWLDEAQRLVLRELADRTTRFVEDLDAAGERAGLTQEELGNHLAEQLNQRMYLLAMIAAVFLPLGFVTGLLGINVGGIPGAESPLAFVLVCLLLVIAVLVQVWWFRRKGWF